MRGRMLHIEQMVAGLRLELELIEVAIRALEQFANAIGVEDTALMPQKESRRTQKQSSSDPM